MRGKDQYAMETSDTGKINVKKLGVGSKQREGFEYEFTTTFLLDQKSNMAESQKDNTHLFEDGGAELLSERHGKKLIRWANSGDGFTPVVRHSAPVAELVKEAKSDIIELASELGGKDNEELMAEMKKYEPRGNPNKINDLEKLVELKETLELMKANKEQEEID